MVSWRSCLPGEVQAGREPSGGPCLQSGLVDATGWQFIDQVADPEGIGRIAGEGDLDDVHGLLEGAIANVGKGGGEQQPVEGFIAGVFPRNGAIKASGNEARGQRKALICIGQRIAGKGGGEAAGEGGDDF